ncbi:MAG: molybdopterin-dependent oxidoreductase [Chloroflexi bacterium]|nr:molybdopterin-dependent oxidoreductase [Chloroflexota bacterium]
MISITIDGKNVEVPSGSTVLEAARQAGVHIPTLCDHPSLKPYGGCRLCVVEVEGMRTLQASCTLPVNQGMVVHTQTPRVTRARQFVLDLIFSERNHFCMYCQKTGGDCELQNAAYELDMTHWPLQPGWSPFPVDASNPYFVFDHNRCILCRRCVRACAELVGVSTLGVENRGASSMVVADYGLPIGESTCVSCGVCVQICPTGALIDRTSAYLGKEVTASRVADICLGCSLGCGIELLVHEDRVLRVDGDWSAPVSGGVICERGRYHSLTDEHERLHTPLVRRNGRLTPTGWEDALEEVARRLRPLRGAGQNGVAALASTRLPAEALNAFAQLFREALGSPVVTSSEEDRFLPGPFERLDNRLLDLEEAGCVLALQADLFASHPSAGFYLRRGLSAGGKLVLIDAQENSMAEVADVYARPQPGSEAALIQGILQAAAELGLLDSDLAPSAGSLSGVSRTTGVSAETIAAAARHIAPAHNLLIVFGSGLGDETAQALRTLAEIFEAKLFSPLGGANSRAAQQYCLKQPFTPAGCQAVYIALGDDQPAPDLLERVRDVPFLAVQASYASPLTEAADVVLPVETWTEQEGHYLNLEGRLQKTARATTAPAGVRSNLEVLDALAQAVGVKINPDWEAALFPDSPVTTGREP